jgi:hypothetical protein
VERARLTVASPTGIELARMAASLPYEWRP